MGERTAIVGGRVIRVDGPDILDGGVLIDGTRIVAVGDASVIDVSGVNRIDATGCWVTPGFVDVHTHLGVNEEGEGSESQDLSETTNPLTPQVRALDAVNPADMGFDDAISGGVLTVNVMPGSGNAIAGQGVALKCWGRTVDDMVVRAPSGVKSALGENPKRAYGGRNQMPSSRMGVAAVIRDAFVRAGAYQRKLTAAAEENGAQPDRDLGMEILAAVLRKELPLRQHCHRADDIATALRLSAEFGYDVVLDHGTDAVLISDLVAARGVRVAAGPFLTNRSKPETRRREISIPARLEAAGIQFALITDHPVVPIQYFVQQAILAIRAGLSRDTALRALTTVPAAILGIADRVGTLAAGKDADVVIWSGDPFDATSSVLRAFIDGREVYRDGRVTPRYPQPPARGEVPA